MIGIYILARVMETSRIPLKGETLKARNFRQAFGGKGSNQAVQAARLGANVSFLGKIGNDSYGKDFLELCKKENINARNVLIDEHLPTATGFIICSEDGHNIITIDMGALNHFSKADVDLLIPELKAGSYVLLQLEIPFSTALYSAQKAKEKGCKVILNPAPAENLSGFNLNSIDYLTPNETEARICLGLSPDDPIDNTEVGKRLLNMGCENVIITLAEKGALLISKESIEQVPAFSFEKIVDSTGAGDAFNGALVVALSLGNKPVEAIRFANVAAGLACTVADTVPSYHTLEAVEKLLTIE